MGENLLINDNLSDEEKYKLLLPQLESLINNNDPIVSNLANISAALKSTFEKISWVGFYLLKNNNLHLGPFQGKAACTTINVGSGVCGASAQKKETIIVDNVHEFSGHIACDSGSNSEIVVPIISNGKLYGVLDLDSYEFSSFNNSDKTHLEKLADMISDKLDLSAPIF